MFFRPTMSKAAAVIVGSLAIAASAQQKVTFQSNWFAQAEHGGLYQAVAEGTYKVRPRRHGQDGRAAGERPAVARSWPGRHLHGLRHSRTTRHGSRVSRP